MADARRRFFDLGVGLALGAVLSGAWVSYSWQKSFATVYLVQMADQANVAREIGRGEGGALAEKIRSALPLYVATLDRDFRDVQGKDWALWAVRDAFQAAAIPPPASIAPILQALPPRASCPPPRGAAPAAPVPSSPPQGS
jgi:hypothetical protein